MPPPATERIGHSLRRKIDDLLRQELTQHWYPHAVDRSRGGFHQSMARDWSLKPDENAFLVYQARMTWTAAAFARYSPAHHDEFVEYARHGIAFLDQVMRDKERGGFHWIVDARGPARARGSATKSTSMARRSSVYAASKVRAVTGDELALKVARDAFDWLEQHAHDARARRLLRGNRAAMERRSSRGTQMPRSAGGRIASEFITASNR